MKKIYFDTNQIFFLRKIVDEAQGYEFGDYSWANKYFRNNPDMINDIKALCYIIALQYQWDLEFSHSDAAFLELSSPKGRRESETKNAFDILRKYHVTEPSVKKGEYVHFHTIIDSEEFKKCLTYINDEDDRKIVLDFTQSNADVLLTSDKHILIHKDKLFELGIIVMRPYEWISAFTKNMRNEEEPIEFLERILFTIGS